MTVEMNKVTDLRLSVGQEIKLAKPIHDLYVGQLLKTVVTTINENEVMLNINGQQFRTKTPYEFAPGQVIDVKVKSIQDEIVLEVQNSTSSKALLQSALLEALPKQCPATQLLETLNRVNNLTKIPDNVYQQIRTILNTVTTLSELPNEMMQAISRSGVFLESALLAWRKGDSSLKLQNDFKAQCLKLLDSLTASLKSINPKALATMTKTANQDYLPLPGAIPQPLAKEQGINLDDLTSEATLSILRDQVTQVVSRINVNQINHLNQENKEGYLIMLDLPVRTPQGIDVVPLMIEHRNAQAMQAPMWSISFAVNLDHLGNIQGKLAVTGKEVNLKFNVEQTETLNTIDRYKNELDQSLKTMGLHLKDWCLQIGLEKNQIDAENLHLLDIRI